ncbi:MAG: TonB family protein [Burkholderiales bacterium]|nr:MAG: TonB family protein [Burkholderiales bacterium]
MSTLQLGARGGSWAGWIGTPLGRALIVSVALHSLVLMLRFAPPVPSLMPPIDPRLEVVLLNAKTERKPLTPEVLAQVSMEGGGESESGRAKSPLPAETRVQEGTDLATQRARVEALEARQRELMSMLERSLVSSSDVVSKPPSPLDGVDEQSAEAVIARLQAQVARQIEDYNKRPRRLTFGINARGVSFARYVDRWAGRIEKIGTQGYPPEARGRLYDSLILTVEIDRGGNVVSIVINRPSRFELFDTAARQIVQAGAPYEPFPPEMAREGDILQIVRTWTFTNDALTTGAVN